MLERTEMVVHGQRLFPGILGLTSPWTVPGVKLDIFAQQIGNSGKEWLKQSDVATKIPEEPDFFPKR